MLGSRGHLHRIVQHEGQVERGGYDPRGGRTELGAGHAHGGTVTPAHEYQGACEDPQTQEQHCEETLATHVLHSLPAIGRMPCMEKTTLCLQEPRASGQYFHIFHPLVNRHDPGEKRLASLEHPDVSC